LLACGLALVCALASWANFETLGGDEAHDAWDFIAQAGAAPLLVVDSLSAPLLPLAALLWLLTVLATLRTKASRVNFASVLVSESILLATLSCKTPWMIIALLAVGTIPPWIELWAQGKPTRIYSLHMALFVTLLVAGQALLMLAGPAQQLSIAGFALLMGA